METIERMKHELRIVQGLQAECQTESGIVKPERRYEYQGLVRQARTLYESMRELSGMYRETSNV